MSGPADLARGWLRKADSDLATASQVVSGDGPYDTACYHAQQAIEKSLKALLAYAGSEIPRTHNLEELGEAAMRASPALEVDINDLAGITPFAVELRYDPDFWPDRVTAAEAIATALRSRVIALVPEEGRP